MISVQQHDFDAGQEWQNLNDQPGVGAVVTFVGLVRDFSDTGEAMTLEHYPGMTENVLEELIAQAKQRWPVQALRIVHRIGILQPGEQIVFVGASSAHRKAAFAACEFLIDMLKTQAPFWKKEGSHWVAAKASDEHHASQWQQPAD